MSSFWEKEKLRAHSRVNALCTLTKEDRRWRDIWKSGSRRWEEGGGGCEGRSCLTSCGACITSPDWRRWEICMETRGSTAAPDPVREKPLGRRLTGRRGVWDRSEFRPDWSLSFSESGRMWLTRRKSTVNVMMKRRKKLPELRRTAL